MLNDKIQVALEVLQVSKKTDNNSLVEEETIKLSNKVIRDYLGEINNV